MHTYIHRNVYTIYIHMYTAAAVVLLQFFNDFLIKSYITFQFTFCSNSCKARLRMLLTTHVHLLINNIMFDLFYMTSGCLEEKFGNHINRTAKWAINDQPVA